MDVAHHSVHFPCCYGQQLSSQTRNDIRGEFMQFLKTILDQLFTRTPRSPPEPSHPFDAPLPSSDAASRRRLRNARPPVPQGSKFAPFGFFPQQLPTHSYANSLRPNRNPPSVRRLLRQGIPHSGLGMPRLFGEGDLMRKQTYSRDEERKEERRLLGGGSEKPDPKGVPIVPGQTFNMKKQVNALGSFRPVDTLSRGGRDSGPVRARGREKPFGSSYAHSVLSPPRSNHVAGPSERSSKRRRVESPGEVPKSISISDDDGLDNLTARRPSVTSRSTALSPTPSHQSSAHVKKPRNGQDSEYRCVDKAMRVTRSSPKKSARHTDRFSSEDKDLSFTRDAAKERRREPNIFNLNSDHDPRQLPEQTSNLSVEILNKPTVTDDNPPNSPPNSHNSATRKTRAESPDELQGEATVGPVPTSLDRSKRNPASIPSGISPSDIRPTAFITNEKHGNRKTRKDKSSKKRPAPQSFKITYFRGGVAIKETLTGESDELLVDPASREITFKIAGATYVQSISLQKILRILVGEASSRKVRLQLSKVTGQGTKFDIELSLEDEKARLCSLLRKLEPSIEVQEKPGDWIDKVFRVSLRESKNLDGLKEGVKRPLFLVETAEENRKTSPEPSKRVKLSDALQDNDGNTTAQKFTSSDAPHRRRASLLLPATKPSETCNSGRISIPRSDLQRNGRVEIPVNKNKPNPQATVRATRSMSRRTPAAVVCDDDHGQNENCTPQPEFDVDQKWNKNPLVYPRYGKKKAEVNASDLERLAPHQFLNDNVIGFYIRFLEDHLQRCNSEVAKRVYFFNSYFFATLTNSPRGKRSINYEGVEKWTRNINLFSYDYIVVPINEDAHWYVTIICNLPYLQGIVEEGKSAARPPSEVREIPETPETTKSGEEQASDANPPPLKEEATRHLLASMSLEKQAAQAEDSKPGDDEWPEREEYLDPGPPKFSQSSSQPQTDSQKEPESASSPRKPRKSKKRQPPGMRYDICQPIIITFDSLDLGRSTTISTLREYLSAEAKSKRGIEINKTLIKGMKAREIPLQPNFSDCGLYLLAYVEKFVQNPDLFIRKLLRKDMRSEEDWPPLRSGRLRTRLRKFMEQLYAEQEQLRRENANDHTFLVDQQPISYLLGSSVQEEAKEKVERENSSQIQVPGSPPVESKLKTSPRSCDPSSQPSKSPSPDNTKRSPSPAQAETQQSVIKLDQSVESRIEPPATYAQNQASNSEIIEVPDSQPQTNVPPAKSVQPAKTRPTTPPATSSKNQRKDIVYLDESDGAEECAILPHGRPSRSGGVEVQIQVSATPSHSPRTR